MHRARLEAEGVDPDSLEGEDGPPNQAMQRALALKAKIEAERRRN